MLRTNTDLFRIALLASFGVATGGCGAAASDGSTDKVDSNLGEAGATTVGGSNSTGTAGLDGSGMAGKASVGGSGGGTAGATSGGAGTAGKASVGGSGGSGTAGQTSVGGSGGSSETVTACGASTPTSVGDVATGLEECENGMLHRPSAAECANNLSSRPATSSCGAAECPGDCQRDSDCTASPYGRCMQNPGGQAPGLSCVYGCLTDADCGGESICVCGTEIGECVSATCKSDADCGEGLLCGSYVNLNGIGCGEPKQFACQTAQDECAVDADCGESNFGRNCTAASGTRVCKDVPGVACGRPFVVSGEHRLARKSNSASYLRGDLGSVEQAQLSSAQRDALVAAWTEIGLMEHASIAAFARFNLQLLALGAPAELVQDCNQALVDETLHARLAFSLASQYAGAPVGPGPLAMDGVLGGECLEEVLKLVIVEGCVGETVAALEAAEALEYCTDPAVRPVLERVVEDERRHAALAWRFVSWAVAQDASLRETALAAFEAAAQAQPTAPIASQQGFNTLPYGVLDDATRAQVHHAALSDVVLPCVHRMFGIAAGVERRAA